MSTNHAEDSLDKRLLKRITELEKAVLALSTPQPQGGDTLKVFITSSVLVGPVTVNPNSFWVINQTFTPGAGYVTIWNFSCTFYIDVLDHDHAWPAVTTGVGGALTVGQRNMRVSQFLDYEETNDSTGQRVFKSSIQNLDTSSHNIYFQSRGYLPKQSGSTAS